MNGNSLNDGAEGSAFHKTVGVLTSKTPTIRLPIETSNASLIEVSWKYLSLELSLSSIIFIES